jgi:hypothetical protein
LTTLDQVADVLAQTYASIGEQLRTSAAQLASTRAAVAQVCAVDPGLLQSFRDDLEQTASTLAQLASDAGGAAFALRNYADQIRSSGSEFGVAASDATSTGAGLPQPRGEQGGTDGLSFNPVLGVPVPRAAGLSEGELILTRDKRIVAIPRQKEVWVPDLFDEYGPLVEDIPFIGAPLSIADDVAKMATGYSIFSDAAGHIPVPVVSRVGAGLDLLAQVATADSGLSEVVKEALIDEGATRVAASALGSIADEDLGSLAGRIVAQEVAMVAGWLH